VAATLWASCRKLRTRYNRDRNQILRPVIEAAGELKEKTESMNRIARLPVLTVATIMLVVSATGCKRLEARDQLNKGVEAYKEAQYEVAIDHFQRAVNLDPTYPMTRTYLATAYSQEVVPGLDTPDNEQHAQMAIDEFEKVLDADPGDTTALKQIATMYYDLKKFDLAKQWQLKVLQADPKDADAAYTIGVIDWTQAYANAVKALQSVGMQDDSAGNPKMPKKICRQIQDENTPLVNDGLTELQDAINIRPSDDEAMVYMNLMYRRKADLDCTDPAARKADLAQADAWREKALGTRRANEEKANSKVNGVIIQ
jgi:tetratricopeptide (TPR) repeat protein